MAGYRLLGRTGWEGEDGMLLFMSESSENARTLPWDGL